VDTDSGRLLNTIPLASPGTMDRMAFHPVQGLLAYGDTTNCIYLWAVETAQPVASVALTSKPHILAFSPDGRHLACGLTDGSVMLWALVVDDADIRLVERWRIQPSAQCPWRLVFSLDGSLLAWNGEQRDIYVATITGGEVLYDISGTHLANCIAFSPDGQHLLTDGDSFDVFGYEALTGEAGQPLTGHASNLTYIAASPASTAIASSDAAGVVKLWDGVTGTLLATTQLSGPYRGMRIADATGLTQGQRQSLLALGAVDESDR
jgi:WD40 repeat protein